jgi:hypothetical protein
MLQDMPDSAIAIEHIPAEKRGRARPWVIGERCFPGLPDLEFGRAQARIQFGILVIRRAQPWAASLKTGTRVGVTRRARAGDRNPTSGVMEALKTPLPDSTPPSHYHPRQQLLNKSQKGMNSQALPDGMSWTFRAIRSLVVGRAPAQTAPADSPAGIHCAKQIAFPDFGCAG